MVLHDVDGGISKNDSDLKSKPIIISTEPKCLKIRHVELKLSCGPQKHQKLLKGLQKCPKIPQQATFNKI